MQGFKINFLYPLELIYRVGFFLSQLCRRWQGNSVTRFKVVAVGNLTTGGTGKSVFVPFLVELIGRDITAIVMRGYGGQVALTNQSQIVSDGTHVFLSTAKSGDEAMMYALTERVPVVVGKNRALSCKLLNDPLYSRITHVILDDAYQNYAVKKDLEIILIDARNPFGNGHCLPVGPLREKDYSRADVIVLTHADAVDEKKRHFIVNTLLSKAPPSRIFSGAHIPAGLYKNNSEKVEVPDLQCKRLLLVAGVGSFQGVCDTVNQAGIVPAATQEFADHYNYTEHDVTLLCEKMKKNNLDGIITTAKDWVKLAPFFDNNTCFPIFVIRVAFEFLSPQEYADFVTVMRESVL